VNSGATVNGRAAVNGAAVNGAAVNGRASVSRPPSCWASPPFGIAMFGEGVPALGRSSDGVMSLGWCVPGIAAAS